MKTGGTSRHGRWLHGRGNALACLCARFEYACVCCAGGVQDHAEKIRINQQRYLERQKAVMDQVAILHDKARTARTNLTESRRQEAADVRRALHVGNATFPSNPGTCEKHLLSDFMVSLKEKLAVEAAVMRTSLHISHLEFDLALPLLDRLHGRLAEETTIPR